jgi:hypothetical protein
MDQQAKEANKESRQAQEGLQAVSAIKMLFDLRVKGTCSVHFLFCGKAISPVLGRRSA